MSIIVSPLAFPPSPIASAIVILAKTCASPQPPSIVTEMSSFDYFLCDNVKAW
jgi:hypothetical protein